MLLVYEFCICSSTVICQFFLRLYSQLALADPVSGTEICYQFMSSVTLYVPALLLVSSFYDSTHNSHLQTQSAALSQAEQKASELPEEVMRRQAAENELHELLTQSTEREHSLKQLREAVGTRDERLKEKVSNSSFSMSSSFF